MKNRWLIALSALGIHISIGSIYAYSVLKLPLAELRGWEDSSVAMAFSIAILFLGLSAAFLGFIVEHYGPSLAGKITAISYSLSMILSGVAISVDSLPLFIIAYGALGGVGLGIGYITPVSTLIKWFPNRRGLATGIAIMGFGFSALIFAPVMEFLFDSVGVANAFYILGVLFFTVIFISSRYLAPPEKVIELKEQEVSKINLANLDAKGALNSKRFYLVWGMVFINISCGIGIISDASPMAQFITDISPKSAATMVGFLGLFNGLGRIGWSTFSDSFGRLRTYGLFFILQIICLLILPYLQDPILFMIALAIIITCYGGGFAILPAFLGDLFGTKELGTIHGYSLTAWAAAGLVGPMILSFVKEQTNNYSATLFIYTGMLIVALCLVYIMHRSIKKTVNKL